MKWRKKEIVLIVNQDARRAVAKSKIIIKTAKEHHIRTITVSGEDIDAAIREELSNSELKRIIIAGGDGTVAKAASLLVKLNSKIELAIIPVGTANYFAKTLGLKSIDTAFSIAVAPHTELRHVCRANGKVFLLAANIGIVSRMFESVSDDDKRRFGKAAYVWGVIRILLSFSSMRVSIKINGKNHVYATTELQIINQSIPERLQVQPDVDAKEPYFEIVTFGLKDTKLSPLFAMFVFALSFGKNQKYVKRIKATKATIETDRREVLSLDGDVAGSTPVNVEIVAQPLRFAAKKS